MSKRTHFTTVTPLPTGISRRTVLDTLHSHTEMIDLNPLVTDRHPIRPPPVATAEEAHCQWYSISDKISYLPGVTGSLTFMGCFHDLPDGLQTHIHAPMGLDMKGRWTLGGSLPGEPRPPQEVGLGLPKQGLWLREDVEMKCNFAMTRFVRKTTEKAHSTLVDRLIEKSHIKEGDAYNERLEGASFVSSTGSGHRNSGIIAPPGYDTHTMSPMPTGTTLGSIGAGSPGVSAYSSSDGGSNHPQQQLYNTPGPHPAYTHQQLQQQAQPPSSYPPDTKHPYDPSTAFQHQQQQQSQYPPDLKMGGGGGGQYNPLPPGVHPALQQHHRSPSYEGHGHPHGQDPSLYPAPLNHHNPYQQHQQQQQQQHPPTSPPALSTNLNPMEFAVELPGGEARTPMELEGQGGLGKI